MLYFFSISPKYASKSHIYQQHSSSEIIYGSEKQHISRVARKKYYAYYNILYFTSLWYNKSLILKFCTQKWKTHVKIAREKSQFVKISKVMQHNDFDSLVAGLLSLGPFILLQL